MQISSLYFLLLLQKKVANLPAGRQGKAEPILMWKQVLAEHFSCQNRRLETSLHRSLCTE